MSEQTDTVSVSDEAKVVPSEVGAEEQREKISVSKSDALELEAHAGRMTCRNILHQDLVKEADRLKREEEEIIVETRKRLESIAMKREAVMRSLRESDEARKRANEAWKQALNKVLVEHGVDPEDADNWQARFSEDLFLVSIERAPEQSRNETQETTKNEE